MTRPKKVSSAFKKKVPTNLFWNWSEDKIDYNSTVDSFILFFQYFNLFSFAPFSWRNVTRIKKKRNRKCFSWKIALHLSTITEQISLNWRFKWTGAFCCVLIVEYPLDKNEKSYNFECAKCKYLMYVVMTFAVCWWCSTIFRFIHIGCVYVYRERESKGLCSIFGSEDSNVKNLHCSRM